MEKKSLTIKETFDLAIQNHEKNNLQVAKNLYNEVLKENPNHVDANNNLGIILQELGEFKKAVECYQKIIAIQPEDAYAYYNLGIVFKELREFQKAIDCFQKVIQIKPERVEDAHVNLGLAFKGLGKLQEAKSCYEKAIQINPNYAGAHNNLGEVFEELGEFQKAAVCYEKVLAIQPNFANVHAKLGTVFRVLEEYQTAANYFKQEDTAFSKAQFLECTYLLNGVENYNKLLSTFSQKDPTNLRVAALAAYVSKKENIKNIYPFCKNPLDYFFSVNLKDEFKSSDQFFDRLLKLSEKLGSDWQFKPIIIKNGQQSTGNLLDKPISEITELKKKIEKQIVFYRKNYKDSDDLYISRWPTKSALNGWYVKLKKQGQVKSHIHENGWLSGVFYLKIPKPLKTNEGSINLSLQGSDYPYDKSLPNFYYAPKPFDLILYPSSLFHYTVPFTSNEERHCIAFDLNPK